MTTSAHGAYSCPAPVSTRNLGKSRNTKHQLILETDQRFSLIGLALGPVVIALVLEMVRYVEEAQREIRQPRARIGLG